MAKDRLEITNYTAFNSAGDPLLLPLNTLTAQLDFHERVLRIQSSADPTVCILKSLECILMIRAKEQEVTAIGKTLGRMALTGIGAALTSKGTGLGGTLLDLSFRGAETKTIVQGTIVFDDTTIVRFALPQT